MFQGQKSPDSPPSTAPEATPKLSDMQFGEAEMANDPPILNSIIELDNNDVIARHMCSGPSRQGAKLKSAREGDLQVAAGM